MFNRYWRTYPWALQLALAFLMIFTMLSFGAFLIIALVPKMTGASIKDLAALNGQSPVNVVHAALIAQLINQIATFMAPALIFTSLTHPRVREYLGLRLSPKPIHWLFVTGIMVGLIPVLMYGQSWMAQHVHLGKAADLKQKQTEGIFEAFLKLKSGGDLVLLLGILALLPAIGEELIFRGVFLRLFHRGFNGRFTLKDPAQTPDMQRSMVLPVILSALLFAFWHDSPYGFAFIFLAGCVLALIYQLTGSLLCCMWAHFLYNGLQVAAVVLSQSNSAAKEMVAGDNLPIAFPLVGVVMFALSFFALVRTQTPLAADWSADFKAGRRGRG